MVKNLSRRDSDLILVRWSWEVNGKLTPVFQPGEFHVEEPVAVVHRLPGGQTYLSTNILQEKLHKALCYSHICSPRHCRCSSGSESLRRAPTFDSMDTSEWNYLGKNTTAFSAWISQLQDRTRSPALWQDSLYQPSHKGSRSHLNGVKKWTGKE